MKKNSIRIIRVSLFAVLAGALLTDVAEASTVTRGEAEYAARRWATSGAILEKSIGQNVVSSETLTASSNAVLHVVRFDGGTAFVSADTDLEPIVAFTTSTNFSPSADSKLWTLLKRDTIVRNAALRYSKTPNLMTTASAGFTAQMAAATQASSAKWAKLLEGRNAQSNPRMTGATPPNMLEGVSDVRCAPLVKSQWSQTTAKSHNCYNYYTPNNDPCGCTATAMSQIMRYFEFPKSPVKAKSYVCSVDGEETTLTMKGGTYDWDNMTLCPNKSSYSDASWEAIGKLTYDAGVSINSEYESSGTGSLVSRVGEALKSAFGYANAVCLFNWDVAEDALYGDGRVHSEEGLHDLAIREKVIYANLDAKCPVELGVYGYGDEQIGDDYYWEGHAIVGDGYGYSEYAGEQVPYVHINLGWHGLDDAWYNVPEIHSPNSGSYIGSSGTAFTVLSSATYNIFPTQTGNIVSGRVRDMVGDGLPGATLTISEAGSKTEIQTVQSDENGIYAFIVPGGKSYDIVCRADNIVDSHTVLVPATTLECDDDYGVYTEKDANVGNYWGHDADFDVIDPGVSNVTKGVAYPGVGVALADADGGDVLAILKAHKLDRSVTLTKSVTIAATNEDAAASILTRVDGAALTVADGATLTLSNVVFAASEATLVTVKNGGCLKLEDGVDLGAGVSTASATGFVLAGMPREEVVLSCAVASVENSVFGSYECDDTLAQDAAMKIACATDRDIRGHIRTEGRKLVWRMSTVPVGEAAGYYVTTNGTEVVTNAYATLSRVFSQYMLNVSNALPRIVIRKSDVMTNALEIAAKLEIVGEGTVVVSPKGVASFDVNAGGDLVMTNVVFRGGANANTPAEYGFIAVNQDGKLTLEKGATLDGIIGKKENRSGVVDVNEGGTMTMREGASIVNCTAEGINASGRGGAIYVRASANTTLNLAGGTITNCRATGYGGGVYVYNWKNSCPTVNLSGKLNIADNFTDGASDRAPSSDDIYLAKESLSTFRMVGAVAGKVGIRYPATSTINEAGGAFITNAVGFVSAETLNAFCNDADSSLKATMGKGNVLVWSAIADAGTCDEADASAHVIYPNGTTNHYANLVTAAAYMANGTTARIEMHKAGQSGEVNALSFAFPSGCALTLTSRGDTYTFDRFESTGITIPETTSLTLSNVVFARTQGLGGVEVANAQFIVKGGSLTLADGACISNLLGNSSRDAGAIAVSKALEGARGRVTMLAGSRIYHCSNCYNYKREFTDLKKNYGCGGGILVDGGYAYLLGGSIEDCYASCGGGVYACNNAEVHVSGDMSIANNKWQRSDGAHLAGNVYVADQSSLVLDGELTRKIGKMAYYDVVGDTNLAAEVSSGWSWSVDALTNSAALFVNDATADTGFAVTNGTEALVVWTSALRADSAGQYYYADGEGTRYGAVGDVPVKETPPATPSHYQQAFGTTATFATEPPVVEITNFENVEGGLEVTVLVKDGDTSVAVSPEAVAKLFQATSDLSDWSKSVKITVSDGVVNDDKSVTYKVTTDGNAVAFIRLVY